MIRPRKAWALRLSTVAPVGSLQPAGPQELAMSHRVRPGMIILTPLHISKLGEQQLPGSQHLDTPTPPEHQAGWDWLWRQWFRHSSATSGSETTLGSCPGAGSRLGWMLGLPVRVWGRTLYGEGGAWPHGLMMKADRAEPAVRAHVKLAPAD